MYKSLLLAWSNIRKNKGQTAIMFTVLLIAAVFMQIGLILTFDYQQNFDRRAALTNSEDVVFSYQTRDEAQIEKWQNIILDDERTQTLETQYVLCGTLSYKYGAGDMNTHIVILPVNAERNLGQFRFVEKDDSQGDDAIYLPYLMKTGGGHNIGDSFKLKIKGREYDFTVGGFYENAMIGSFNGGISSFLLTENMYGRLDRETDIQGVLFSVKLYDGADDTAYHDEVGNLLSADGKNLDFNSSNYSLAKTARTLTATICSLIFLGVALLITTIALVITMFHISNGIEENMSSYGALKSIGYTGAQIIRSLLLQFLMLSSVAALAGIAVSYALLPLVDMLLVMQTGLIWEYAFNALPVFGVLAAILGTVALTAYLAAGRLRRLQPITALRQGVSTHNFKHNPLPLDKSRGHIGFLLAMKAAWLNVKQNAAIFLIVFVLSFSGVFMSVMLQAFVIDYAPTLSFLAGEQADAALYTSAEDADEVFAALQKRPEIQRVYRYQDAKTLLGGEQILTYLIDDSNDLNNPEICYDGRLPKHPNEIALGGAAAKAKGLRIGDTVVIKQDTKQAEYYITGFIQNSNHLGKDAVMLNSGYERIATAPLIGGFYMLLHDGYDINEFIDSVTADGDTAGKIAVSVNIREVIAGVLGVYTSLVAALVMAFLVIVLAIIALAIYLMAKTFLIRKKKDHGIQKALGFTTRQLVLQTALGFMPVVLIAALVGFSVGIAAINPLLTLLFSGIGIMKATFVIPAGLTAAFAAAIIIFSFAVSCLVSLRIRKITPRALIAGE